MRDGDTTATFTLKALGAAYKTAEVMGEQRQVSIQNAAFQDHFGSWDVHLYRLSSAEK